MENKFSRLRGLPTRSMGSSNICDNPQLKLNLSTLPSTPTKYYKEAKSRLLSSRDSTRSYSSTFRENFIRMSTLPDAPSFLIQYSPCAKTGKSGPLPPIAPELNPNPDNDPSLKRIKQKSDALLKDLMLSLEELQIERKETKLNSSGLKSGNNAGDARSLNDNVNPSRRFCKGSRRPPEISVCPPPKSNHPAHWQPTYGTKTFKTDASLPLSDNNIKRNDSSTTKAVNKVNNSETKIDQRSTDSSQIPTSNKQIHFVTDSETQADLNNDENYSLPPLKNVSPKLEKEKAKMPVTITIPGAMSNEEEEDITYSEECPARSSESVESWNTVTYSYYSPFPFSERAISPNLSFNTERCSSSRHQTSGRSSSLPNVSQRVDSGVYKVPVRGSNGDGLKKHRERKEPLPTARLYNISPERSYNNNNSEAINENNSDASPSTPDEMCRSTSPPALRYDYEGDVVVTIRNKENDLSVKGTNLTDKTKDESTSITLSTCSKCHLPTLNPHSNSSIDPSTVKSDRMTPVISCQQLDASLPAQFVINPTVCSYADFPIRGKVTYINKPNAIEYESFAERTRTQKSGSPRKCAQIRADFPETKLYNKFPARHAKFYQRPCFDYERYDDEVIKARPKKRRTQSKEKSKKKEIVVVAESGDANGNNNDKLRSGYDDRFSGPQKLPVLPALRPRSPVIVDRRDYDNVSDYVRAANRNYRKKSRTSTDVMPSISTMTPRPRSSNSRMSSNTQIHPSRNTESRMEEEERRELMRNLPNVYMNPSPRGSARMENRALMCGSPVKIDLPPLISQSNTKQSIRKPVLSMYFSPNSNKLDVKQISQKQKPKNLSAKKTNFAHDALKISSHPSQQKLTLPNISNNSNATKTKK